MKLLLLVENLTNAYSTILDIVMYKHYKIPNILGIVGQTSGVLEQPRQTPGYALTFNTNAMTELLILTHKNKIKIVLSHLREYLICSSVLVKCNKKKLIA